MIRLAIICFLISMIESKECNLDITKLNALKQLFNDAEHRMEEATRSQKENAAIVLGNAKSGKSTLINYLIGNALIGYKNNSETKPEIKIKNADNSSTGPEIGIGSVSVTTIPTKWNSRRPELQNLDIWVTAGLMDNGGIEQDLNNSFHLYHLIRKVDSLKLILVINYDEIVRPNPSQILNILKILESYFNKTFKDIFSSISVVISKATVRSDNRIPIDFQFINYKLATNLLSPGLKISNVSKDFIQHIINNSQRVAFFRKMQITGMVNNIDDNIIPAIVNSTNINKSSHQNIGFVISKESKLCLEETAFNLLNLSDFFNLIEIMNNKYAEAIRIVNVTLSKSDIKEKKSSFQKTFDSIDISSLANSDATSKIKILQNMYDAFKIFIEQKQLVSKISLTGFIDSIIMSGKITKINILLEAIIKLIYDRISLLIAFCRVKENEINLNDWERKLNDSISNEKKIITDLENQISNFKVPKKEIYYWTSIYFSLGSTITLPSLGILRFIG